MKLISYTVYNVQPYSVQLYSVQPYSVQLYIYNVYKCIQNVYDNNIIHYKSNDYKQ